MKKAVVVSCFGSYFFRERLVYIYNALEENGFKPVVLMSDFDHIGKQTVKKGNYPQYVKFIKTLKYNKNLSIARILSHIGFSVNLYSELNRMKPDMIYFLMPPNLVGSAVTLYCKKNIKCHAIADVMDLWPESLPIDWFHKKWNIVERIWKWLRCNTLENADYVVYECNLYKEELKQNIQRSKVIYLPMKKIENENIKKVDIEEEIKIGYIGQVSHLIDIDLIERIVENLSKDNKVSLHIIGDGIKYKEFIERMGKIVDTYDYGVTYDDVSISKILGTCHYALNIMKENIKVGLTMKSMTYISLGIPLINSIKGDTWDIIDKYNIGVNVADGYVDELDLVSNYDKRKNELIKMREKFFSKEEVKRRFSDVVCECEKMVPEER